MVFDELLYGTPLFRRDAAVAKVGGRWYDRWLYLSGAIAIDFLSKTAGIEVRRDGLSIPHKAKRFLWGKERPRRVVRWATIFKIVGIGVREGSRIVDM